jgi:DNA-binding transcriptional MerR regulator
MSYTTFEIVKNLEVRQERLREWIDRGFITPSVQKAQGRGSKNLFSKNDLYKIRLFQYLLCISFSRERASQIVNLIFHSSLNPTPTGGTIVIKLREEGLREPYLDGEMVFDDIWLIPEGEDVILNFRNLFAEIDSYEVINLSRIMGKVDVVFQE